MGVFGQATRTRTGLVDGGPLPATLRAACRAELARCAEPPFEVPIAVAVNASMVLVLWYLAPLGLRDWLFNLHGELALPMVLAVWMYSDVPATNLVAPDRHRMMAAIGDRPALGRLITAKNLVLWLMVSPVCLAYAVGLGLASGAWGLSAVTMVWIAVAPFGTLGVASWLGIWFPYHPLPLRVRFEHRRPWWPMVGRWLTLVLLPYAVVPTVATAVVAPSALLWGVTAQHGLSGPLSTAEFAEGTVLTCAVAVVAWTAGHAVGIRWIERRRTALAAYLADPLRG